MKTLLAVAATGFVLASPASAVVSTSGAVPSLYKNCTNLNKTYRHGVGRAGARDRVRGQTPPVTTFLRSTKIYRTAMSFNSDLDRDRDGVACETR